MGQDPGGREGAFGLSTPNSVGLVNWGLFCFTAVLRVARSLPQSQSHLSRNPGGVHGIPQMLVCVNVCIFTVIGDSSVAVHM